MVNVTSVRAALQGVNDPELRRSVVELGMVRDIWVDGDRVFVTLALTTLECPLKERMLGDIQRAVRALPGVAEVVVDPVTMTPEERDRLSGKTHVGKEHAAKQFNNIEHVITVMSGKGGVGKSLVTGLLAVSLAREGRRVGVLDADVTGPSIPKMFGLHERPEGTPCGLVPIRSGLNIEVMSINLLAEHEDDPVIWRGPLIAKAIEQFYGDVLWRDLDYLLVDLPPGTADAPLTVMQSLPLTGTIIVSSPQDLANMVVRKAVRMARQMNVPILGVVENLSYFVCPDTGKRHEVFGPSRGEEMALTAGAPLLARLPIDPQVARLCDLGRIEEYQSEAYEGLAKAFSAISMPAFRVKAIR